MFARFKSQTAEALRSAIGRLAETEIRLYSQLGERRIALGQVEDALCDVSGDDVEAIVSQRAKAQAEVEAAAAGITAAHTRRVTLIGEWYRAQGSENSAKAAKLKGELERHRIQVGKALDRLAEVEGLVAEEFRRGDPVVAWYMQRGPNHPITRTPKSIELQGEIAAVEHEAMMLGRTNPVEVNSAGAVQGRSIEEVVADMLSDPTRVTPSALAVERWAREAERQNPHLRPQQPRIYRMAYVGSRVVEETSSVRATPVPVLEPTA